MPTEYFSFEDGIGSVRKNDASLFADRTSPAAIRRKFGLVDSGGPTFPSSTKGRLPLDSSIRSLIEESAKKYGVPVELGLALAQQESDYNPEAFNPEFGATGLFQYIPETARAMQLDPTDPAQSADAAMRQFAEQMQTRGTDWAIKHHFGGPDEQKHGPKTAQYLADVSKKASDIAGLLGISAGDIPGQVKFEREDIDGELPEPPKEEFFSLEEALGPGIGVVQPKKKSSPMSQLKEFGQDIQAVERSLGVAGVGVDLPSKLFSSPDAVRAVKKTAVRTFEHLRNRLLTDLGQLDPMDPRYSPTRGRDDPFAETRRITREKEEQEKVENPLPGFVNNLENPVKLILENSLPANFLHSLATLPEKESKRFWDAQKVLIQENIVENPDKFPTVTVEAARQMIAAREEKQDPGVREMWDALRQAAKEDPGKFGAHLVNSLMSDPYLMAAPIGIGIKPVQATRAAITGIETTSRLAKSADAIVDAAVTSAAINTAISAGEQLAHSTDISTAELKNAAVLGAAIGGPLGLIFTRGARAKIIDLDDAKVKGTYEEILRDRAKYDLEAEELTKAAFQPERREMAPQVTTAMQARINGMLGITEKAKASQLIQRRRADTKAAFKNEADYADYLKFKAEERVLRSQQYAEELRTTNISKTRESERASLMQERAKRAAASRSEQFQKQFDAAVAARNLADLNGKHTEALELNTQVDALRKMDVDDAIESAWNGDVPAIKRAFDRIDRKDRLARHPKWQRGSIGFEETGPVIGRHKIVAENYRTQLNKYTPVAYRETSIEGSLELIPYSGRYTELRDIHLADSPEAALGQGKNTGVLLEFDTIGIEGFVSTAKPAWEFSFDQGMGEYITRGVRQPTMQQNLRSITVKPEAVSSKIDKIVFKRALDNLVKAGWIVTNGKAGAKIYTRPDAIKGPKSAQGGIAPELMGRLGLVGAGTALGVGLAPEESRAAGGFLGGLAGLLLPAGGGTVLRKMRQSGVVSPDGNIFGLVLKGKQLPEEVAIVERAKAGDQLAYKALFDHYSARLERTIGRNITDLHKRAGVDANDIMQQSFIKAFENLDTFQGNAAFYTWLYKIAENELLQSARKGIRRPSTEGMSKTVENDMAELGELASRVEEQNPAFLDTPESMAIAGEVQAQIQKALDRMPAALREAVELVNLEGLSHAEVAKSLGIPKVTVRNRLFRGKELIAQTIRQDLKVKVIPKGQRGEVDLRLLKASAAGILGAGMGMYLAEKSPETFRENVAGAITGGLLVGGLAFAGHGKGLVYGADELFGAVSTRILNNSPAIFRRSLNHERTTLELIHKHIEQTDNFILNLKKLPESQQSVVARALMTGDPVVINKLLQALDRPELSLGYKSARNSIDDLGDQLVMLKRITRDNIEYFPRVVKDKEGLFKQIGRVDSDRIKSILTEANAESMRKSGQPLNNIEESAIINRMLFTKKGTIQPGFAKPRGIEEITPELLPFYATPAEALHSYIRAAVRDIERAKFFKGMAVNVRKGEHEYLDVDMSVNNLINREMKEGRLTTEQADEIADLLKARFGPGERAEPAFIQDVKNLGNIGLLGNFWSASTQLGDVVMQVYVQDLRSTLSAVVRQLTGTKIVDMRSFGLADAISAEFANTRTTAKWVDKSFKVSLFKGVDRFGKNTALNAAIIRARRLAKTESGQLKLANKYADIMGEDFSRLINDLKSGKVTDLTKEYAFAELSRTQPVSRLELPAFYLKHPELRSYMWLKSFMIKQADLARRDGYNSIKAGYKEGDPKKVALGVKALTSLGVILGLSGMTSRTVKDFMLGRDLEFSWGDIPINMLKTFGFSQYERDRIFGVSMSEAERRRLIEEDIGARKTKAIPIQTLAGQVSPPYDMFETIIFQNMVEDREGNISVNPKIYRYLLPPLGPYITEQFIKEEQERRGSRRQEGQRRETRR